MFRRYPISVAILAAIALLASWPDLARAQSGYTQLSNSTLTATPYKFCGMLLCQNATIVVLGATPYNVGGGAIAQDNRLVMSCVNLPYNYGVTGNAAFTQKNYFAIGYNSTAFPTTLPVGAKAIRGYVYGAHYASLVAANGFFYIATLAVSFGVFYSESNLITGTVPSVVDVAGANLGSNITKLVVGYPSADYTEYQTGPITDPATVISDPLWYFPTPSPIIYPYIPFMGGSVWIKESNQWAYEGVALIAGLDVGGTGTAFELMNAANLQLITNALTIIGTGGRTGPPRPTLNATNVYTTLPAGKVAAAYQHVQVNNAGNGTLRFTATSSQPWLKISPASGATSTQPVAIALSYNTGSMKVGTYNALVTVSNQNGVKNLNVQLQVVPTPPPAPTGVAASTNRSDGVLVTWNAVPGATSYEVFRGPTVQPTNPTGLGTTTATNFIDTSAVAQQPYHYFVKAVESPTLISAYSRQAVGIKRPTP